jgi:hypothetical protein
MKTKRKEVIIISSDEDQKTASPLFVPTSNWNGFPETSNLPGKADTCPKGEMILQWL